MLRVILFVAFVGLCAAQVSPADFCQGVANRRNQKDLYPDNADCHRYYQCFYVNETFAIGFNRQCPAGTFWHDQVLSCLPEGSTPCVDRCLDDATAANGWYAGIGCRQFFVCANTASYGMCCPVGTRFNGGACAEDLTCTDACVQAGPLVPTSAKPSAQFNSTVCQDSFGTYISTVDGEANAYYLIDDEGHATGKLYCPTGVSFDLDTCRCDIENGATQPTPVQKRQATAWITFDQDSNDHSVNKFATFLFDGAQRDSSVSAFGGASLYVNGGYLSLPGLKSYDSRQAGSWCAFFRCEGSCSAGGIISNNKDSANTDYTVVLGTTSSNNVAGRLLFWQPVGSRSVNGQFQVPSNGWNHVCLSYDSNTVRLYLNGAVAESANVGGYLAISHYPYVIGNDQALGHFNGHIDDVLITPFALTQDEVDAHRNGDRAYLASKGFF